MSQTIPSKSCFSELLQCYDILEYIQYLVKLKVLSRPKYEYISKLQTKEQVLHHLAQLRCKDKQFCQNTLTALKHFAVHASRKIEQACGLSQTEQISHPKSPVKDTQTGKSCTDTAAHSYLELCNTKKRFAKEGNSDEVQQVNKGSPSTSSSSSPEDLNEKQCQEVEPDSGYFTGMSRLNSNSSMSTVPMTVGLPAFTHLLPRKHPRPSKKATNVVNYYIHNYYTMPSISTDSKKALTSPFGEGPNTSMSSSAGNSETHHETTKLQHMEKTVKFIEILRTHEPLLLQKMNTDELLPFLNRENLLTTAENEVLTSSNKTRIEKSRFLLSVLPTKCNNAFELFVRCLEQAKEHSSHRELAVLLKEETTLTTLV